MPQVNFYWLFITASIPMIVGLVYYSPKVFGKALMTTTEIEVDNFKKGISAKGLAFTYLFGLFMSYIIFLFAVHQSSIFQLFLHEKELLETGTELNNYITDFMDKYGTKHRTFGHGIIHGIEITLFMGLGMIGISTIFERRPMKYMWIHLLFWVICGALMGGVLCAWM